MIRMKNNHLGKRTGNKGQDGSGLGQGMSAGYEITDDTAKILADIEA